jgi:hypothetical protein
MNRSTWRPFTIGPTSSQIQRAENEVGGELCLDRYSPPKARYLNRVAPELDTIADCPRLTRPPTSFPITTNVLQRGSTFGSHAAVTYATGRVPLFVLSFDAPHPRAPTQKAVTR